MATPPTYGLTNEGYVAPTQEKIRAWLAAEWKELFGANSTVEASSINGKLIDFATRIAVTYFEGGAGAANAGWFAAAPGVALEKILSLFAFPRLAASSSTVSAVLYGADATVVNAGAIASVEVSKDKFLTTAGVTIGDDDSIYVVRIGDGISPGDAPSVTIAGTPYSYVVGLVDTKTDIALGIKAAIELGGVQVAVFQPGNDPNGDALLVIEDNGLGPFTLAASNGGGPGDVEAYSAKRVDCVAEQTGPRTAFAGTLNTIETQVTGWDGVTNTTDADLGRNAETDAAYRARHRDQLQSKGSASAQAIRDAIAQLDGVTYVAVRENPDDVVDGEGLPPHSIRVTVLGGDSVEICETIYKKKAAGIQTYGAFNETIEDSEGNFITIYYQRPTSLYMWIRIDVSAGEKYPGSGDPLATIASAVALWGDINISIGDDVERFALGTPINTVPGIKAATITMNYTLNELDPQPPLFAADLVVASTELPLFDSSRIIVNLV